MEHVEIVMLLIILILLIKIERNTHQTRGEVNFLFMNQHKKPAWYNE